MNGFTTQHKWDLLIATGGNDLEDLILHQAKIETRQITAILAAQDVAAVAAVNPTPWEDGLELCRNAISRYTNQIVARNNLFSKMPASNYFDWRKWG